MGEMLLMDFRRQRLPARFAEINPDILQRLRHVFVREQFSHEGFGEVCGGGTALRAVGEFRAAFVARARARAQVPFVHVVLRRVCVACRVACFRIPLL